MLILMFYGLWILRKREIFNLLICLWYGLVLRRKLSTSFAFVDRRAFNRKSVMRNVLFIINEHRVVIWRFLGFILIDHLKVIILKMLANIKVEKIHCYLFDRFLFQIINFVSICDQIIVRVSFWCKDF